MIQTLRQKHRLVIYTLAIILPLVFIAGLAVRRPIPVNRQMLFSSFFERNQR